MKSVIAVAFLLATVLALSEARRSHELQTCDKAAIQKNLEQLGQVTADTATAVGQNIAAVLQEVPSCAKKGISKLLPCLTAVLKEQGSAVAEEIGQWGASVKSITIQVAEEVKQCLNK